MDMESFKSINEQRATVRHGRLIPVVSGLRPVAICIEWLTRTHTGTGTRTAHTMNPANDSMTVWQINMFAIGAKESIKKDKRNLPKNVSKRSASLHACLLCPQSLSGLFIVRSQIQHLRVRQLLVLCQFGALQI